jgi:hypothetical protein
MGRVAWVGVFSKVSRSAVDILIFGESFTQYMICEHFFIRLTIMLIVKLVRGNIFLSKFYNCY